MTSQGRPLLHSPAVCLLHGTQGRGWAPATSRHTHPPGRCRAPVSISPPPPARGQLQTPGGDCFIHRQEVEAGGHQGAGSPFLGAVPASGRPAEQDSKLSAKDALQTWSLWLLYGETLSKVTQKPKKMSHLETRTPVPRRAVWGHQGPGTTSSPVTWPGLPGFQRPGRRMLSPWEPPLQTSPRFYWLERKFVWQTHKTAPNGIKAFARPLDPPAAGL